MKLLISGIVIIVLVIAIDKYYQVRKYKKLKSRLVNQFGSIPRIKYLNIDDINSYSILCSFMQNSSSYVDSITWNDLNMDEVYKRICSCKSKIGMEYLYHKLHNVSLDINNNKHFIELLNYFNNDIDTIASIQLLLSNIKSCNKSIVPLLNEDADNNLKYPNWIYNVLALLTLVMIVLTSLSIITSTFTAISLAVTVSMLVINGIVYYKTKILLDNKLDIISQLFSAISVSKTLINSNHLPYNNEFKAFKTSISDLKNIKPSLGSQSSGIMAEFSFMLEYVNIIFLIDIRKYNKSINEINRNMDSLKCLYEYLGNLDSALSVLSYRESLDSHCEPTIYEENIISFKEIYHPLIDNPVVNDGLIDNNTVITGANSSGKSTYIKAIAINNIFALTINTCLAKEYKLRPMFTITSMALRDDVVSGESYYITEIKSLKRILDKVDEIPCLCMIDEILRGTNTVERLSASLSVLEYIQRKDCYCIVATHDVELAQRLKDKFNNLHFEENVTDESIEFNYMIKEGIAKTKNAIKLLSYYKFDKDIIDEANRLVMEFEKSDIT